MLEEKQERKRSQREGKFMLHYVSFLLEENEILGREKS